MRYRAHWNHWLMCLAAPQEVQHAIAQSNCLAAWDCPGNVVSSHLHCVGHSSDWWRSFKLKAKTKAIWFLATRIEHNKPADHVTNSFMMSSCTWPYHSCIIGTCHALADMFVQHRCSPLGTESLHLDPNLETSQNHTSQTSPQSCDTNCAFSSMGLVPVHWEPKKVHIWHLTTGLEQLASSRRFQLDNTFLGSQSLELFSYGFPLDRW